MTFTNRQYTVIYMYTQLAEQVDNDHREQYQHYLQDIKFNIVFTMHVYSIKTNLILFLVHLLQSPIS